MQYIINTHIYITCYIACYISAILYIWNDFEWNDIWNDFVFRCLTLDLSFRSFVCLRAEALVDLAAPCMLLQRVMMTFYRGLYCCVDLPSFYRFEIQSYS